MRHTSLWSLKLFRDDDEHLQKYSEETASVGRQRDSEREEGTRYKM